MLFFFILKWIFIYIYISIGGKKVEKVIKKKRENEY